MRTIRRVDVVRKGSLIALTFEGEGFLYKMVRMLTAAAMRGRRDARIWVRCESGWLQAGRGGITSRLPRGFAW